jgi:transcriptional regulator with XRE-family HTH domain
VSIVFRQISLALQLLSSFSIMIPAQCRAARGLLDWTQQELADRAGVGIVTIRQVEAGTTEPRRATIDVIRRALITAGVEFIDENGGGPGVRLRKRQRKKGPS